MRKIIILTVTAAALLTAACNTVAGIGRDAQAAAASLSRAVQGNPRAATGLGRTFDPAAASRQ